VIFGPAVTVRRTSWRDRGGRGIPGRWPTAALGRCAGRDRGAVPAEITARASGKERERERGRGKTVARF
jgi:hypothetical protein